MTDLMPEFKLEDRPKLTLERWFKWLAIISFTLAVLIFVSGFSIGFSSALGPVDGQTTNNLVLRVVSRVLENLGYFMVSVGFYGLMLWLASKAIDYLDQLVWLNATDEDRRKIISQRTK